MIHPLVRLLANEPHLLTEHLSAYAGLIGREAHDAKQQFLQRLVAVVLVTCCLGVAAMLAGVAVMLWAVTPNLEERTLWILVAAPALPALIAVATILWVKRPAQQAAFSALNKQLAADVQMIQEAGSP